MHQVIRSSPASFLPQRVGPRATRARRAMARCGAAVLLLGSIASAQEAVKEPNWPVVRRTALAPIDRNTVQQWIESRIQNLFSVEDAKAAPKACSAFYQRLTEQHGASDAAPEFKSSLGELVAAGFTRLYRPAENAGPNPLGVSAVLMVLRDSGHASGLPCFEAGLTDASAGPRFVAAEGLLALRQRLSDAQWSALVPRVAKAAATENNNAALNRLFRVLQAAGENPNRANTVAAALQTALDARLADCEQKDLWPLKADAEIVAWLADRAARSNDAAQRIGVMARAGRLLAAAASALVNDKPGKEQQEDLEDLAIQVETRLEALALAIDRNVKPPDVSVRSVVAAGGADRREKIVAAVTQWIGSGQTQGVLNRPPFNLPVGRGIVRESSTTATAPASP